MEKTINIEVFNNNNKSINSNISNNNDDRGYKSDKKRENFVEVGVANIYNFLKKIKLIRFIEFLIMDLNRRKI